MHDVCTGIRVLTPEAVHFPKNSFPRGRYQILGNTHLRTSCSALTREWRIGGQTSPYRILAQVERVAVQDRPVTTLPETPQLSETKSTFRIVVNCASTYGQWELTHITFLEFGHGRAAHWVAHALRPERHGREGQVAMLIVTVDTLLYHA